MKSLQLFVKKINILTLNNFDYLGSKLEFDCHFLKLIFFDDLDKLLKFTFKYHNLYLVGKEHKPIMTKNKFNKLLKKSSGKTIDDLYIEYINLNLSNKDLIEFINKNKIKKLEFYKNKMNNLIVDYVMDKCLDLDYFTDDNVCYLKNTVTFY